MAFGDLLQAVVDTTTLPIAVTKDVITLGKEQETKRKVADIGEDLEDFFLGNEHLEKV